MKRSASILTADLGKVNHEPNLSAVLEMDDRVNEHTIEELIGSDRGVADQWVSP